MLKRSDEVFGMKRLRAILWEFPPGSQSVILRKEVTADDLASAPGNRRRLTEDRYYSRDRGFMERWYARH